MRAISLYETTAFLGAFLAFFLELAVGKLLLPRFGGSAGVWTACVLCFQALLFAGYGWCYFAAGRWRAETCAKVHWALLGLPALFFPIRLPEPGAFENPFLNSAWSLCAAAGAPFFVLSTANVALQSRLRLASGPAGRDPHFLFAASNAGAAAGLFAYVFAAEPLLSLQSQFRVWYGLYALYAVFHAACLLGRGRAGGDARPPAWTAPPRRVASWFFWSAAPCAAMLAATNSLTLDFAAAPLVWVAPLALYLFTLVHNFKRAPRRGERAYALVAVLLGWTAACAAAWLSGGAARPQGFRRALFIGEAGCLAAALFVVGLVCHRSLARDRPLQDLTAPWTAYYLAIAAGGWFGSFCVGVLVPWLGRRTAALWLDWAVAGALAAAAYLARDGKKAVALARRSPAAAGAAAVGALALAAWTRASAGAGGGVAVFKLRNFYGIYAVVDRGGFRRFMHGSANHGMQSLDPALRSVPQYYYNRFSPLHDAFEAFGEDARSVGVVGLGAGGIAPYGRAGTSMDFYELDPDVAMIADRYFTYLRSAPASVRVIVGDARLSMERESGKAYDLLVLDAFNSGAMPTHLLTEEALRLYLSRLRPGGVILIHVSNRHLDLRPMLAASARDLGLAGAFKTIPRETFRESERVPSSWVAVGRDPAKILLLERGRGWTPLQDAVGAGAAEPWTDQRSSLLRTLTFR